jgi:3-methyladenine DNA glycosylase AlkC
MTGTLRPERPHESSLPLLEAAGWAAGLPGASLLAREAEARGYFKRTLAQQWQLIQEILAEHLREARDPEATARAWGRLSGSRLKFHLPGAWTRVALDGPAEPALALLREWAASGDRLLGESLPETGIRPWAEKLGPDIVDLLLPWAADAEPEVRRAAVVAVRPRGVWVAHLGWAVEAPALLLPLFEALRTESDPRVAGAIANAWNDIAQTQPQLALELAHRWRAEQAGPLAEFIARRGLRSLLKDGDPRALHLMGLAELEIEAVASLRGGRVVPPNSSLIFDLELSNQGAASQAQLVYELELPGRVAGRPRRQRVQAGTYLLPEKDRVRLILRERIFDRRAAPVLDGPAKASFFVNGKRCAELDFRVRRLAEPGMSAIEDEMQG